MPAKRICYLHKKFATLPQQAIRGRLAGIYPICAQQQWPREISSRFFDLVLQKELVGRIVKINLEVGIAASAFSSFHVHIAETAGTPGSD